MKGTPTSFGFSFNEEHPGFSDLSHRDNTHGIVQFGDAP